MMIQFERRQKITNIELSLFYWFRALVYAFSDVQRRLPTASVHTEFQIFGFTFIANREQLYLPLASSHLADFNIKLEYILRYSESSLYYARHLPVSQIIRFEIEIR